MMRYIQKAICGAKTFSDTPIYSQLQNIIFTTVEDQLWFSLLIPLNIAFDRILTLQPCIFKTPSRQGH